jgi:hypothetical protein
MNLKKKKNEGEEEKKAKQEYTKKEKENGNSFFLNLILDLDQVRYDRSHPVIPLKKSKILCLVVHILPYTSTAETHKHVGESS